MNSTVIRKGDCDCCERTDVVLAPSRFDAGMLQCEACSANEAKVTAAVRTIDTARKLDDSIELKADIFNAATVSFVELEAAVQNNSEIPAERKNYALAELAAERIDKLNPVIFEAEQALLKLKNERYMWLENTQKTVAKLRTEQQAKFKQYNVNYKPEAPSKKVKTVQPVRTAKAFDKKAVYEAARKYGVPAHTVQGMVVSRNGMSPEAAAKELAELLK
jgi:hypothetical protein